MTETVVVRHARRRNFTTLSNVPLRDPNLSWKAKGMLANLFSHAEGFPLNMSILVGQAADGKHATNGAIKELQRHGYLSIRRERNSRGHFVKTTWIIRDEPEVAPPVPRSSSPVPPPHPDFQDVDEHREPDNRDVDCWTGTNTEEKQLEEQQPSESSSSGDLVLPIGLKPSELEVVNRLSTTLPAAIAQQVIDELAAKMAVGAIKSSPVAYLRSLIERAKGGTFTPSAGLVLAEQRARRSAELEAQRCRKLEQQMLQRRMAEQRGDPASRAATEAKIAECRAALRLSA